MGTRQIFYGAPCQALYFAFDERGERHIKQVTLDKAVSDVARGWWYVIGRPYSGELIQPVVSCTGKFQSTSRHRSDKA